MAFPKKKSRSITVNEEAYTWICISRYTLNAPNDIEPNEQGILPSLPTNVDWCGYEDVYGFNSHTTLIIQKQNIKVHLEFDGSYFFGNVLDQRQVTYLSITPKLVKACIEYLNEQQLWTKNTVVQDAALLFKHILLQ